MNQARVPFQDELSIEAAGGQESLWESFRHGKVSFLIRRLEPQLAWAVAAYTTWAALFLDPSDLRVWGVTIYAAAIGFWCRMFPAHHQWLMLVRGMLLLAGAFVLQIDAPTGPYFIWPVMVASVYALLLAQRWAVVLSALALAQFAAACWLAGPPWRLALAQAGVLVFFPFVATMFGSAMRALDRQVELSRMDRGSHLYNEQGFFTHGAELFDECRRKKRPFSLVLLNSADLREVADLVGKKAANQLFAHLIGELTSATPREGIAARTDLIEFALALPGLTADRAQRLLQDRLGEPPKIELPLKGSRITVMLDSVVAEATPDIPTLEDFYDRLRSKLLKRFGVEVPNPPERSSTLHGLLEDREPPVPRSDRPTMPMGYGKS